MYEEYWQLETKPFEPTSDRRFLFPCPAHTSALHKLRYAVENRRPAALLAGTAGIGKTLLWHTLEVQLGESLGKRAHLVFPLMSSREMLAFLAEQLGAPLHDTRPTVEESLNALQTVLVENRERGKLAIFAVDEAHLLEDAGLLEPLRLLMNLRDGYEPLFTLLLIGQVAALSTMERANDLDERLEMKVLLKPFSSEETAGYIEHRLVAAGATRPLFTSQALELAHQLTGGIPRRINRLCDLALLVSFAAQESQIDGAQLRAVQSELLTLAPAA
ncbi:ExeA family protein [Bythopirellula polymerisocia]|uniref:NACHT domain protein n=1 Tax=Bythopirellula polymerisocia TaxID=2528003 RepID=A0A5C6CTH8_9BACT|nr:AAA family ATPase [Bythopirellula polymerisocia]TWU27832.1 NACHT domain protein [Bythopirellula polymerisocia]